MRIGLLLVLLLWSAAAAGAEVPARRPDCKSPDAAEFFFPKGALGERGPQFDQDASNREWYSKHLRSMGEPSLSCGEARRESYRFLWLRTWGHPIAVRVEISSRSNTLTAVELDGAGGYEPGKVSRRVQRQLSVGEWKTFSDALKTAAFWKMQERIPDHGLDGAQWIMEGRSGGDYRVVDRWSPETGAYRDLCLMLVKLAGLAPSGNGKKDGVY
jgi:hypothetical protein